MNRFEWIWIAVVIVISGTAYMKHGNDSLPEIWAKECHEKGMILYHPDMVEVLQGQGDFICLPRD